MLLATYMSRCTEQRIGSEDVAMFVASKNIPLALAWGPLNDCMLEGGFSILVNLLKRY